MHKSVKILVIILVNILFMTGCWDSSDINKKNITTLFGVAKKGENYVFYDEIANLVGEESKAPKYTIYKSFGKTFAAARDTMDVKLSKPLYMGTAGILLFSVPLVEYGMEEYMYRLRSLHDYRTTLHVVTTRDDIEELMSIQKDKDISSGALMETMLDSLTKRGEVINVSASQVIEWLCSDYDSFLMPNIDMNENNDGYEVSGYTVVNDSVYAGFIPSHDSMGIVFLLNKNATFFTAVPLGGREVTCEGKLKKKKISAKYQDNKVSFDIEMEFKSVVKYLDDDMSYTEEDNDQVNSNLEKILLDEVQYTVDQAQTNFKCDFLGFNKFFRAKYPGVYKKMNWDNEFIDSEINIKITNELDPGGAFDYDAEVLKEGK